MVLLLLSRMGRRGEKIMAGGKGGKERGDCGEMGGMRMSKSSLTLETLMSDLVLQLAGHFLVLPDGRNPP